MHARLLIAVFLLIGGTAPALARPVSWPGGWMVMAWNDTRFHSGMVSYSFDRRMAAGATYEYWREDDWHFAAVQVNWLAKRWNFPDAQANIYLMGAAGAAHATAGGFAGAQEPAGFLGLEFDAEDRRFYVSYEARAYEAGEIDAFFMQKARFGVAPYIGRYGDLHTWLMLQVDNYPESTDPVVATALVRLFKGNILGEVGVSDDGEALFNLTVQF